MTIYLCIIRSECELESILFNTKPASIKFILYGPRIKSLIKYAYQANSYYFKLSKINYVSLLLINILFRSRFILCISSIRGYLDRFASLINAKIILIQDGLLNYRINNEFLYKNKVIGYFRANHELNSSEILRICQSKYLRMSSLHKKIFTSVTNKTSFALAEIISHNKFKSILVLVESLGLNNKIPDILSYDIIVYINHPDPRKNQTRHLLSKITSNVIYIENDESGIPPTEWISLLLLINKSSSSKIVCGKSYLSLLISRYTLSSIQDII